MNSIGVHHNLKRIRAEPKHRKRAILCEHSCNRGCARSVYVFRSLAKSRRVKDHAAWLRDGRRVSNAAVVTEHDSAESSSPSQEDLESFGDEWDDTTDEPFDHLEVASEELRRNIIMEWQSEMSTEKLKLKTCAVCAKEDFAANIHTISCSQVDLTLLRNEDLPSKVWPTTYEFERYQRALLCSAGLSDCRDPEQMQICGPCEDALGRGSMPRFALANWLYSGREALPDAVREAFDTASIFERMMISRVRYNSVSCRFKASEYDPTEEEPEQTYVLRNYRKGVRGNVLVTPLDVGQLHEVLPPPPEAIRDTMSVIFIGSVPPTRHTVRRLRPVLVRKSKVKVMLDFLLAHNIFYHRLKGFRGYSEENLNALFDGEDRALDESVPGAVHVGFLPSNDAVDSASADYTPRNVDGVTDNMNNEILMENVGFTLGDHSPASYRDMKLVALERCLAGKAYLGYRRGSGAVPDFDNPALLSMAFPEEDPWGICGIHHPLRRIKIGAAEQVSHLLTVHGGRFQRHPEFAFFYHNVLRKQVVSHSMRYKVPHSSYKSVVDRMLEVDLAKLAALRENCSRNPLYVPMTVEEKDMMALIGSVGLIARHVPGSAGQKVSLRNEIRGVINYRGAPTLFITLNPSDVDNPIVRLLVGEDIRLEDIARGEDMDGWSRKVLAARNPAACAKFFDLVVRKFISVILRYGKPGRGLFG
ncbi:hypothetical protein DFH06DRAFT_1022156, partial [Mycena polygramma]